MSKKISIGTAALFVILGVVASANITYLSAWKNFNSKYENYLEDSYSLKKLMEVKAYVDDFYIGEYDINEAIEGAVGGFVEGVGDKWSHYLSADEYQDYKERSSGSLVGIGVSVEQDSETKNIRVLDVFDNSPAMESGIAVGDLITHVDGTAVNNLGFTEAVNLVKGEENSSVELQITSGESVINLNLTRRRVETVSVKSQMLDGNVGYVKISNFDQGSDQQFSKQVDELIKSGATSLVFDVRFNPGGLVDAVANMLDKLLPEGPIITLKDSLGQTQTENSDKSEIDLKMAVIVNEKSVSAAEFFAAALREYDKAVVVGEHTLGKGYSQIPISLSDGSALVLSTSLYYTPLGNNLADVGIEPDVAIKLSDEQLKNFSKTKAEDDIQVRAAVDAVK